MVGCWKAVAAAAAAAALYGTTSIVHLRASMGMIFIIVGPWGSIYSPYASRLSIQVCPYKICQNKS